MQFGLMMASIFCFFFQQMTQITSRGIWRGGLERFIPVSRDLENQSKFRNLPYFIPKQNYRPLPFTDPYPPTLKHNLLKVLHQRGPHFMKDISTGIYNFDKWVENIDGLDNAKVSGIPEFVRVGEDKRLQQLALMEGLKFCSSTSSVNDVLIQLIVMISNRKTFSRHSFSGEMLTLPRQFSPFLICGASSSLKFRNGVYCLESRKSSNESENVLLRLGKVLELFLTTTESQFNALVSGTESSFSGFDSFHYAKVGRMLIRAQLDSYHPSLPRKTFDLKTRAVLPIRKDVQSYKVLFRLTIEKSVV
jgi:hypothetical protein